ncbi:MAG: hypothetical protein H0U76_21910, partial [Ktedonobacteraceae bacterium]|nr:hypothetical protein [Ktedonobacteraceae bacterium]
YEDSAIPTALASMQQAEISFNYLGQFDTTPQDAGEGFFRLAHESSGPSYSLRAERRYMLEITSMVAKGRFHVEWRYSAALHRSETIEQVAQRYLEILRALIAHCRTPGVGSYTPSDFSGAGLDQAKLDKIMTKIRIAKRTEL